MTTTTEAPARAVESVTSVLSVSIQPKPKSVAALFLELQAAGIVPTVTPDGRGLAVPAGKLSPELRARVVAHKAALIDYLTQPTPPTESVMSVLSVSSGPNPKSVTAPIVEPGCSNCEAATAKQWHGGYTMHCVGCMARLVSSARPSRQQQETMLACLELRGSGRPDRPTRQQVLERLQRR